jgi:peroxiredoxin family protein
MSVFDLTESVTVKNTRGDFVSEKKKLALIIHSGTLDKLYCAFILGSTATTMRWEAHLYFTFWGLHAIVKGAI